MDGIFLEPWLPPAEPDLARLAMEAADDAGLGALAAWPEWRKGGVGFLDLPPFLPWHGVLGGRHHLVLVQPREVGALVPGSRPAAMPSGWLDSLDLPALARPLARHPGLGGQASVHVVQLLGSGRALVRTFGEACPDLVTSVLQRLTGVAAWTW